jgi:CubicO group peptidase (beta-lactamase class C family)
MAQAMDLARWQPRLDELARRHAVPGASLAVLADGEVTALATGVLHTGTGVAATTDSLFQLGSITKVYTATVLLRLVDQGLASLDTPVVEILPEFRVADPEVSRRVTLRHLLSHTSGIDGDFFLDTGRGDDCLAAYVRACADLTQNHPLGVTFSYCNTGYVILGRVIEVLTGMVWDRALAEQLVAPLGLAHTWTLPEDVLRFRAAMGHLSGSPGQKPQPAPSWSEMRSIGPANQVCATAADVVAFARLHLDNGLARDATQVLAAPSVAEMQHPQVDVPNPYPMAHHWGLGWALSDWSGRRVYGHDGDTIGQSAFLRVIPDAGVAVALLTNRDRTGAFYQEVFAELLDQLCDLDVPAALRPPAHRPEVDLHRHVGVYERIGTRMEARLRDGNLLLHVTPTGPLAERLPAFDMELIPLSDTLLVGRPPIATRWLSYVFYALPDGRAYLHDGARATPKVSGSSPGGD